MILFYVFGAPIYIHNLQLLRVDVYSKRSLGFCNSEFLFGKRRHASSELFGASNVLSFFLTLSWHILAILTVTNNNHNLNFGIVERGSDLGAHGCRSGSRLYQGWGVQMRQTFWVITLLVVRELGQAICRLYYRSDCDKFKLSAKHFL